MFKSIKHKIMLPVFVLGIMSLFSSIFSIKNLASVNLYANEIANKNMTSITSLGEIQGRVKEVYNLGLSHIISTSHQRKIVVTNNIKNEIQNLSVLLKDYENNVPDEMQDVYENIKNNYSEFVLVVYDLLGLSANGESERAYNYANEYLTQYGDLLVEDIQTLTVYNNESAKQANQLLGEEYSAAKFGNLIVFVGCILSVILILTIINRSVIHPIRTTKLSLDQMIGEIESRAGDLTRRMPVLSDDEVGALSKGINLFIEKLQVLFYTLSENTGIIETVSTEVTKSTKKSQENADHLSSLTEELSATMQEVASRVDMIYSDTEAVAKGIGNIAEDSVQLHTYSNEMRNQADVLADVVKNRVEEVDHKMDEILDVVNIAIGDSKSVTQISELSNEILDITDKTNLLALNASIEAARVGEAGRGFAVVASEITQLANSSRETANRIQNVNNTINTAVQNLSSAANQLVQYIKQTIRPELMQFMEVGERYKTDADYIEKVMNSFNQRAEDSDKLMKEISQSLYHITVAINEGVNGIGSTAESTVELAEDMKNITNQIAHNSKVCEELKNEMSVFQKF